MKVLSVINNDKDAVTKEYVDSKAGVTAVDPASGSVETDFFIPTKTSDLTNDSGFITEAALTTKQDTLVSGTNIKTINNQSLLGSGNIDVSGGGGTPTDVRINGTSITNNNVADIITQGTYNASSNKIATMSDIPADEKVKQSNNTTSNAALKVLFTPNVLDTAYTGEVNKNSSFTYNPTTKALVTGGTVNGYTLADASAKSVDSSISASSTSTNLPTSQAVVSFVEGKGYTTNTGTITGVSVNGTSVATSGVANITSVPASILTGAIPSAVTATTQLSGDNSTKIATTAYVDGAITALPEPMVFKGSLGTGGTITTLPTASASNEGYTYKVITAGTYASQAAKIGDTFISDGSSWILIPSGDEPSGTVTSITLNATSPILIDSSSAITTSGTRTLSHATSGVTAGTYKSVTVDNKGHVTAGTNPTTLSGYGITDALTDAQVNGTSVVNNNVANIVTEGTYNASSNKIATMSDITPATTLEVARYYSTGTKVATLTKDEEDFDIYVPTDSSISSSSPSTTNLPTSSAVSAFVNTKTSTKQDTLVSGTNIKTINNTSLLGSGNVSVQPTLVSGTNIKTVNSTSLLGSGNIAVQPTLISGTNIKTINGTSLLGSGNIDVSALVGLADTYQTSGHTYHDNDLVVYNNQLYQNVGGITSGSWDSSKWTAITISDLFGDMNYIGEITGDVPVTLERVVQYIEWNKEYNAYAGSLADFYSSGKTYAIGDYVMYFGQGWQSSVLYKCTTTISTPEAWNSNHWDEVTMIEILEDKIDAVLEASY